MYWKDTAVLALACFNQPAFGNRKGMTGSAVPQDEGLFQELYC